MRRLVLAAEASAAGRGGQAAVARATGASRGTIRRGIRELGQPAVGAAKGRIRHPGGGRKRTVEHDPSLREDLDRLVEPTSRGDPESPLRWTCKSVRQLAAALKRQGHQVSHRMVAELLHDMGYSLQANRKTLAGTEHPDRNAQFEHLDRAVQLQLSLGEPVISVDTKKKELVGPFKNGGRELRPKGAPEQVLVHDFLIPGSGPGQSLWGVRYRPERGLGQCGDGPRYGCFCRREHPALVGAAWGRRSTRAPLGC